MTIYLETHLTAIGPEVADLAQSGVLILFADGSPDELADVSVLHRITQDPLKFAPNTGSKLTIGEIETRLTAVGDLAWEKILDLGHVVITFNGADISERPGEICAAMIDPDHLIETLKVGARLTITA